MHAFIQSVMHNVVRSMGPVGNRPVSIHLSAKLRSTHHTNTVPLGVMGSQAVHCIQLQQGKDVLCSAIAPWQNANVQSCCTPHHVTRYCRTGVHNACIFMQHRRKISQCHCCTGHIHFRLCTTVVKTCVLHSRCLTKPQNILCKLETIPSGVTQATQHFLQQWIC